jgi:hypothetical protein
VYAGKACGPTAIVEPLQCILRRLDPTETLHHRLRSKHRQEGLVVDAVVTRVGEVAFDPAPADDLELLAFMMHLPAGELDEPPRRYWTSR